ncbi:ABC transporter ATP-binding protein [Psittacicella gerlachiana]|uniref:ABC transporter domain-containing protein n=1 Tax=Psittacicella gerlachiana TaxID=2028574 RepID=A0A3A1YIS1_9GAMM|nr:ATP-binding cassette domain-containing protein [Psittacicella gerlachiana]RIY37491.1 hypothetical protein CKF59_01660 [Psittacicella gerlachiana]
MSKAAGLIELHEVGVYLRDGSCIVEPINFTLEAGQALTLLGQTGSGKSLLAQALMADLPPDLLVQGQIKFQGQELSSKQRQELWGRQWLMLPQEPREALDPTMPLGKQVAEGFRYVAQKPKAQAWQLMLKKLQGLGLGKFVNFYPHQISGGMAQRAAFAAATCLEGQLLIADEPTKGLDEYSRQQVIDLLKAQQEAGVAILTITHDLEVAKQLGGKIMVLAQGKLCEQGLAPQVLSAPQHPYTQAIIEASQWAAGAKARSQAVQPHVEIEHLTLHRGKREIVKDLSFKLYPGQVVGLYGPSGVGKSTIGEAVCGLLKPSAGKITWHLASAKGRPQVLKLYQDPLTSFATHVTLRTLLQDVIKKHQLNPQLVPQLMEKLQLNPALLERKADQVSGGELQRLAILRVLLFEPKVIFADEITSRLDPLTQRQILDYLVQAIKDLDCALLLVSHERGLIDYYCQQVIDLTA